MVLEYYKISAGRFNFMASVDETPYLYRVKFGGSKVCVFFSVYKDDEDKDFPNMDGVGSDKHCDVHNTLHNKEGTILMIKSSLIFLLWRFPYIKHVQFLDTSKKECANKVYVDLATFHFAKYGKTWYQDHFGATPLRKNYLNYLKISSLVSHEDSSMHVHIERVVLQCGQFLLFLDDQGIV